MTKQTIIMYVLTFFMLFVHIHAQRTSTVPHERHYYPDQDFGVPVTKKERKKKRDKRNKILVNNKNITSSYSHTTLNLFTTEQLVHYVACRHTDVSFPSCDLNISRNRNNNKGYFHQGPFQLGAILHRPPTYI